MIVRLFALIILFFLPLSTNAFRFASKAFETASQVVATTNKAGKVTSYQYYAAGGPNAGLLYCETGPTGKKKCQNYNTRGR